MASTVISGVSGRFSNASSRVGSTSPPKKAASVASSGTDLGGGQGRRLAPGIERALFPCIQRMRASPLRSASLNPAQPGAPAKTGETVGETKAESKGIGGAKRSLDMARSRGAATTPSASKSGSAQPKSDIADLDDLDGLAQAKLEEGTSPEPPVMRMRGGAGSSAAKSTGSAADRLSGDGADDKSSVASLDSEQAREAFTENPGSIAKAPSLTKSGSLPLTAANLRKHNRSSLPKSSGSNASVASKPGDPSEKGMGKVHDMANQDMQWEFAQQMKQQVMEMKEKRFMGWLKHVGQMVQEAGKIAG
jgi:hypothetical protein